MPGLLETTIHQGYDYIDPYVRPFVSPYVEKARNAVPLIDRAAKKAEEIVPPLITRADELAEPTVEKMRPYVEPRIEQVKETVTPYMEEGVKYYNAGCGKVEQIKEFKDAKTTQIKDFKDAKTTQIKDFKDAKATQIKEFKEARTTQLKEFTEPKVERIKVAVEPRVTQLREFAEPKVDKIRDAVEPRVKAVTAAISKKKDMLPRVPKSADLKGLNCTTLLGNVALSLEKVEVLIDQYLPLTEEQKQDTDSDLTDASTDSDSSCYRINRSLFNMKNRLLAAYVIRVKMLLSFPLLMKAAYTDGTLKVRLTSKVEEVYRFLGASGPMDVPRSVFCLVKNKVADTNAKLATRKQESLTQLNEKMATGIASLTQTSIFKKVVQVAVVCSQKIVGKDRTTTLLSKVQAQIPAQWKAKEQ